MKKIASKMAWLVFLLGMPQAALALETSASVKVTPLLKTTTTWNGAPITYPTGKPEFTALIVEVAPGGETGWHQHPVPSFAYVMQGTLEVSLKNGAVKRLKAGETLAEVIDTPHNGRNVGKTPLKLIVFYASAAGLPLTSQEP